MIAWDPGRDELALRAQIEWAGLPAAFAAASLALCPHGGGPPTCWCRPPLPGLLVPWLQRARVNPRASLFIGSQPAHERLAAMVRFPYTRV